MAGYADVVVLRHPEPGAVSVSLDFSNLIDFTRKFERDEIGRRVYRFVHLYSESSSTL